MMCFLKRIFKYEIPGDKYITVNKQAIELHEKEQKIYKETLKFEKKEFYDIRF